MTDTIQYATKKDLTNLENKVDAGFARLEDKIDKVSQTVDNLAATMSGFANDVNERFDAVDIRFNKIEAHLDAHDEEFRKINSKYDRLINTIDGFIGRIDRYEIEQKARDNQFNKLLEWAHKVSEKTGIPLENL